MSERLRGTIGIIEADPGIRSTLGLYVAELGFRPVEMSFLEIKNNPREYRRFMRKYDPNLLIVDVPFPYEESARLVDRLEAFDVSYNRPFILTTTNRPAVEPFITHHNNITFLDKPFDFEELEEMLGRLATPRGAMRFTR